jgi:hypothetical protein
MLCGPEGDRQTVTTTTRTEQPKEAAVNFGKPYTDAEIGLILAFGSKATLETLAAFLGRNPQAIDMVLRWGGNYSNRELLETDYKDNKYVKQIRRVRKQLGMR